MVGFLRTTMYKRHAPAFVLPATEWQIPDSNLVYYEIIL